MSDFLVAPAARDDLTEIWRYYAAELQNIDADRIRDELFDAFRRSANRPASDIIARIWSRNRCVSGACAST